MQLTVKKHKTPEKEGLSAEKWNRRKAVMVYSSFIFRRSLCNPTFLVERYSHAH